MNTPITPSCPLPISEYPMVTLGHGSGGRLMNQLIDKMIGPAFASAHSKDRHDGAVLPLEGGKLAFTTDSYVVHPLFFPGGNIGDLAVYGTVNDLAMCGARPRFLSAGFIIEEGFPMEDLWKVICAMRQAAELTGVGLVTGDTKVVDKGKGDGMYINTSGIGTIPEGVSISPRNIRPGDGIILSGDIGRHGIAVMARREGLAFESEIESDCAPLHGMTGALIESGAGVHCLRDLTRGGLSSALVELAEAGGFHFRLDEKEIPVREDVRGACEILGFDPLYVANEGRCICFVPEADCPKALAELKKYPPGKEAALIGYVSDEGDSMVTMTSVIGGERVVDMLSGDQLPRIC